MSDWRPDAHRDGYTWLQRRGTVLQAGSTVFGDQAINTDAVWINLDGYIRAAFDTPDKVTVTHHTQQLRIINEGPFVAAHFDLHFTPTINSAGGFFYIELPQKAGLLNTTEPLETAGLLYRAVVDVTGVTLTGKTFGVQVHGGATSPTGVPYMRLSHNDGATSALVSAGQMTSGSPVRIRGWHRWPVNRFK